MQKQVIVTFVTILLVIPLVFAGNEFIYPNGEEVDLKISCFMNGTYCSGSALCNLTIQYPNGSLLINNQEMTNSLSFHNYTLLENQTDVNGDYHVSMVCDDSGTYGFSTFDFTITPDGSEQTTGKAILFGLLILVSLVFCIGAFAYGINSNKPAPMILGVLIGILFMVITYQTIMLVPEIQGQINLYDSTVTIYEILMWVMFAVFIMIILYMLFLTLKMADNPQKANLQKWGLLMDDEK